MLAGMKRSIATLLLTLGVGVASAQVQIPPTTLPAGQSRLPTETTVLPPQAGVATDCRTQSDAIKEQYRLQEQAVRKEMADREKLADDGEKQRLRAELEQRVSALKLQSVEAQRRVQESCRG